jgi:hypothetical protein
MLFTGIKITINVGCATFEDLHLLEEKGFRIGEVEPIAGDANKGKRHKEHNCDAEFTCMSSNLDAIKIILNFIQEQREEQRKQ